MQQQLEIGTNFWQLYQGYTASGFGQVSKIWEISEYLGNGIYKCKPISDNTVIKLNPYYTENFNEVVIRKMMRETPILEAVIIND